VHRLAAHCAASRLLLLQRSLLAAIAFATATIAFANAAISFATAAIAFATAATAFATAAIALELLLSCADIDTAK
jgi:hypothetical protein